MLKILSLANDCHLTREFNDIENTVKIENECVKKVSIKRLLLK
tara:strand:+ start:251 stop:379 length:129 start_codon:yes stop_codon:yes gene_type:complete